MALNNNPNLENPGRLIRQYAYLNLGTGTFGGKLSYDRQKGGVPLMYNAVAEQLVVDPTDSHTLVFGSSGSKKTRTVVMPSIHVLAQAGESMIIHDAKGELYARTAAMLMRNGYEVIPVNFRKPECGYAWNPLDIPYRYYKLGDMDRAAEFSNDVASTITLGDVGNSKDPFWEHSAHDCLFGLILLLFRYCKENNMPDEAVNMANLASLRRNLFRTGIGVRPMNSWLWKWGSEDELIASSLSGTVMTADDTMKGILSILDQKLRTFIINNSLMDMLANSNFDLDCVGQKKTALFLITPDEKTSYHPLVAIFVSQSYQRLIYLAEANDGRVACRVNYILDEFSSLPAIGSDFSSMIAAARSRNIRFLLVAQSKSQLVHRYREEAATIMANCNNWIIMFTRELELLREISELCGTRENGKPNVTVYDLQHLSKEQNQALLLAGRLKPMVTELMDIKRMDGERFVRADFPTPGREKRHALSFDNPPPSFRGEPERKPERDEGPSSPVNWFKRDDPFKSSFSEPDTDKRSESSSFDVEELVAEIDRKIAELEAEEELEKVTDQIEQRRRELLAAAEPAEKE